MSGVQFVADRGNGVWTLKFNVDRIHASAATAVSFVATHAAVFAGYQASIDLQITVGATVLHLLGAALTALTPAPQSDQSSFFSYEFTGPSYG